MKRHWLFNPSRIDVFNNPYYIIKRGIFINVRDLAPKIDHGRLLDVGCESKPYRELFPNAIEYVGLDYDSESNRNNKMVDIFYESGGKFPLEDGSFDNAISTEVLEHVFEPDKFISEIHRVLKPGGKLLLTTPLLWEEHFEPVDYGRYSSYGLKYLMEKHGFRIIEQRKICPSTQAIAQMIVLYTHRFGHGRIYKIFIGFVTSLGYLLERFFPYTNSFYLCNVVLVEKKINLT